MHDFDRERLMRSKIATWNRGMGVVTVFLNDALPDQLPIHWQL
jgi:hypothetical protein